MTKITEIYNGIKLGVKLASDWRFSGRKIELAGKSMSRGDFVSVITKLDQRTKQLTQQDIKKWRQANQVAIDIENPKRFLLLNIYDDAMHDLHLKGAVRNRKLSVLGKPFKMVNEKGEPDHDLTNLLKTRWFKKFMSLALDAKFYGHSLIELTDIDREGKLKFKEVNLIPRHHVCPEYGVILIDPMDIPQRGIPFENFADTCISVCEDKRSLGELNSPSKEAISKKFILQFWDTFGEIFGMPLRVGKTTSRDPKDHAKVENMLDQMGSAAWGLFPEGTTIEMIGSKQADAYQVYDKRVERANSEMSKGILGQTMTMDDGSSLSQAKVHEEVADEVSEDDREFILNVINDDLLPFLLKHGWPVNGYVFAWDDAREYTPKEMKEIEAMLLGFYDIDPEYFIEKYGVTILGKKEPSVNIPPAEPDNKKKRLSLQPGFYD